MKVCRKCKKDKDLSEFYMEYRSESLRAICKECHLGNEQQWRSTHREQHNAGALKWAKSNPEKVRAMNVRNYKKQNDKRNEVKEKVLNDYPCLVCGENEHILLDFHHLDPTVKENSPSSHSLTWRKMLKEISKCVVLCCKCHRRYHAGKIQLPEPLIPIDASRYAKSQ